MKPQYYIRAYRLTSAEKASFLDLVKNLKKLYEAGTIKMYAHRWILEIRPKCRTEIHCRAVLCQTILAAIWESDVPGDEIKVALAWTQMITDHIQLMVDDLDARCSLN